MSNVIHFLILKIKAIRDLLALAIRARKIQRRIESFDRKTGGKILTSTKENLEAEKIKRRVEDLAHDIEKLRFKHYYQSMKNDIDEWLEYAKVLRSAVRKQGILN